MGYGIVTFASSSEASAWLTCDQRELQMQGRSLRLGKLLFLSSYFESYNHSNRGNSNTSRYLHFPYLELFIRTEPEQVFLCPKCFVENTEIDERCYSCDTRLQQPEVHLRNIMIWLESVLYVSIAILSCSTDLLDSLAH